MPYYEAQVSVTRTTTISAHGKNPEEARESILAQMSSWDSYVGGEILEIHEKEPIKYKPIMEVYNKPTWRDRPPGKIKKVTSK